MASPASAAVACASLPTMEGCIECGSAKYGYEKQIAFCRNHWKPERKAQSYDEYRKKHNE